MKIEDIEHKLSLFLIHKKALEVLSKQIAHFQSLTPPHIQIDYDDRTKEIIQIISDLKIMIILEYPNESDMLHAILLDFNLGRIPVAEKTIQRVIVQEKTKRRI